MNRFMFSFCQILLAGICWWPGAASASEEGRDLASQTRSLFAAKCAGCHGADLAKPRGRFGYVLDLARVAANPEMVVPSSPDESEIWELVRRGEMPPDDAPTGPLSQEEKELVRAWIAAGAPADSPPPARPNPSESIPSASSVRKGILHALGPFHLVVVHFPIALFIAAAIAELWYALRGSHIPMPAVRFCVLLGAASAVIAASLGWIHAGHGHGAGSWQLLRLHRWIGTATAAWGVGTALFSEWDQQRGVRSQWFRVWLFMAALLVAVEGHFGGMLVHGDDFLSDG
jgi:mono/diheme cytochrome c family protein/uncharacterized membrane protein